MGASASLFTAAMTFESLIPAMCWIAPETPKAMYNSGATIFPVWPTWNNFLKKQMVSWEQNKSRKRRRKKERKINGTDDEKLRRKPSHTCRRMGVNWLCCYELFTWRSLGTNPASTAARVAPTTLKVKQISIFKHKLNWDKHELACINI